MPQIRRLRGDEWQSYRALRLQSLSDSPDAFSRTLEFESAWPDAQWMSRVDAAAASELDLPLVVDDEGRLVGLAWGKIFPSDPATAHLF